MVIALRPSSSRRHTADIYERIIEVASANLGCEAQFLGARDWIFALFQESFPEDCPATVDRRLLSNFVQRAVQHGTTKGLIVPRLAPRRGG
jgi:hypothetical protein